MRLSERNWLNGINYADRKLWEEMLPDFNFFLLNKIPGHKPVKPETKRAPACSLLASEAFESGVFPHFQKAS